MTKILVTGGGGFIGSNLIKKLEELDFDITIISNNKLKNKSKKTSLVIGNISNEKLVSNLVKNTDLIIHLAAFSDVKMSFEKLDKLFKTNIQGTFNILKNISNLKKKPPLIFLSSSTVYGNNHKHTIKENSELNPTTPFAMSKIINEQMCLGFSNSFKIPVTILRPFTVYGKNAPIHQLIPKLVKQITTNNFLIVDNPNQIRDFIFIDDLIDAILCVIKKPSKKFRVYNVGNGKGIQLFDVAKKLVELFPELNLKIKKGKINFLDKKKNIANVSLIKKDLGWTPKTDLHSGLKKILY